MSTTGGTPQGTVLLTDPPDVVAKKIRSAVTDSGREVRRGEGKEGIENLIEILSMLTGESPEQIEQRLRRQRLRPFKGDVADAVVAMLDAGPGALHRAALGRGRAAGDPAARRRPRPHRRLGDAGRDEDADGVL